MRVPDLLSGVTTPWCGPSAIPTSSPINRVAALDEYNDADILLPAPKNHDPTQYTETEVVLLLSDTKKGSPIRGEMMRKMMRLGYTPGANIRSLQHLMLLHENGKMITDSSWESNKPEKSGGCRGIQSGRVDMQTSAFHREYCHGLGWFMDPNGNWHAKDCSNECVDNNARCVKSYAALVITSKNLPSKAV